MGGRRLPRRSRRVQHSLIRTTEQGPGPARPPGGELWEGGRHDHLGQVALHALRKARAVLPLHTREWRSSAGAREPARAHAVCCCAYIPLHSRADPPRQWLLAASACRRADCQTEHMHAERCHRCTSAARQHCTSAAAAGARLTCRLLARHARSSQAQAPEAGPHARGCTSCT